MAGLTHYGEELIINTVFKNKDKKMYIGLLKQDPTDSGNVAEVNGSSYQRQVIEFSDVNLGETYNNADVTFPVATENWGWVSHIGVFDEVSGGNLVAYSGLDYSKEIRATDIYKIPQAYFVFKID